MLEGSFLMRKYRKTISMKMFFVGCQETCPMCQGSRVVANPLWARFFAETGSHRDADLWARDNGFDCALDLGPEEEPCQDCDGQGAVQRLVPLHEALSTLNASVA